MGGTPPKPEELARWLLSYDDTADDTPEGITMAAVHIYEQLRTYLSIFLGPQGFDALWARALHLVRRAFPWEDMDEVASARPPLHRLDSVVRGRPVDETRTVLLTIFTQFLALLFIFIGADLSFRLLQQHWPALPVPPISVPGEEAQQ